MQESMSNRGKNVTQSNAALFVIDVQQGLFRKSTPIYQAEELLQNILALIHRAHGSNVPVFFIQHSDHKTLVRGSPDWQLHPRLRPLTTDCIIHKQHGNAFQGTDLEEALRSRNVTHLVITGLVTHGCVRATCIGALQLGYTVILAKDGHSNFSKQAAMLIEEWNEKLESMKVELKSSSEIRFG